MCGSGGSPVVCRRGVRVLWSLDRQEGAEIAMGPEHPKPPQHGGLKNCLHCSLGLLVMFVA